MVSRQREKGFTVVELACAFAVVSVLAVALVHTGHGKTQSVASAFRETLALRICQGELERVRSQPRELVVGDHRVELPADASRLPNGRGVRTVREIEPGLFEVEVEVTWQAAGAGSPMTVNLVTRVAKEGGGR